MKRVLAIDDSFGSSQVMYAVRLVCMELYFPSIYRRCTHPANATVMTI